MNSAIPQRKALARLKQRLAEMPDDPVALNLLGKLCESLGPGAVKLAGNDPLLLKAAGVLAYRMGDYPRAADRLRQSSQKQATDGQVFFYLAMARFHENQTNDLPELVARAKALYIKPAEAELADQALGACGLSAKAGN